MITMTLSKILVACSLFSFCHLAADPIRVLAFAGSTREDSVNRKLVAEAAQIAKNKGAVVSFINLQDYPIPIYEGDFEASQGMPLKAKELRKKMLDSQVILIASPEFNGSIPAILKNIIDWASRDEKGSASRDAYKGKKFVLLSASPGGGGGARGLVHLRSILEAVGGTVLTEQMTLPVAYSAFDEQGHLKDPRQAKELDDLIDKALKLN